MISFPYAYHCGFNVSLNCAESCNFASSTWVPYGLKVKPCKCFAGEGAVQIKMSLFTCERALEKLRREECKGESSIDDIVCETCGLGHDEHTILICDSCTSGYHLKCLVPPLSKKPPGQWLCPECHTEAEEETRLALEKEAKNRKCCACGSRGEEAGVQHLLASAWAGAALDLGPAEPGRFSLCKKCASKQESSWRLGPLKSSR